MYFRSLLSDGNYRPKNTPSPRWDQLSAKRAMVRNAIETINSNPTLVDVAPTIMEIFIQTGYAGLQDDLIINDYTVNTFCWNQLQLQLVSEALELGSEYWISYPEYVKIAAKPETDYEKSFLVIVPEFLLVRKYDDTYIPVVVVGGYYTKVFENALYSLSSEIFHSLNLSPATITPYEDQTNENAKNVNPFTFKSERIAKDVNEKNAKPRPKEIKLVAFHPSAVMKANVVEQNGFIVHPKEYITQDEITELKALNAVPSPILPHYRVREDPEHIKKLPLPRDVRDHILQLFDLFKRVDEMKTPVKRFATKTSTSYRTFFSYLNLSGVGSTKRVSVPKMFISYFGRLFQGLKQTRAMTADNKKFLEGISTLKQSKSIIEVCGFKSKDRDDVTSLGKQIH